MVGLTPAPSQTSARPTRSHSTPKSRTKGTSESKALIEKAKQSAAIFDARGQSLRHVPPSKGNKTSIPNSKASTGSIPGTVHAFFRRVLDEFNAKHYKDDPPPWMGKDLSNYEIKELSKVVLPECTKARKKDRKNARRVQSACDYYNFSSGAAGLNCLYDLKDLDNMTQLEIEALCKELRYDPDNILNLDKSTALPGNRDLCIDKTLSTEGTKANAKEKKIGISTAADVTEDDIQGTGLGNRAR